jgi:hypothetical protein
VLKNLVHLPEKPFSTASVTDRRPNMSAATAAFSENGRLRPASTEGTRQMRDHGHGTAGFVIPHDLDCAREHHANAGRDLADSGEKRAFGIAAQLAETAHALDLAPNRAAETSDRRAYR